jgi:hypothetical protein
MEGVAIKTGHLTPQLLKKELLKMKHPPGKIYITHMKTQYLKSIKAELQRLKIENLRLLREEEIIEV